MAKGKLKKKLGSKLKEVADDIKSVKVPKTSGAKTATKKKAAPKAAPKIKTRVMKRNDSGTDVDKMQKILGIDEDGFGFATQVAVQHFQRENGLTVTGIVDEETQAKMFG